jgi:putative oxygen-independent coproporphyrinogen III oxidase
LNLPPLTLYIHLPWCVSKCPYCDFNSYQKEAVLPEKAYIQALLQDLKEDMPLVKGRKLSSVFIGGGTPSLFTAQSIDTLLTGIDQQMALDSSIEITMEVNPGTFEQVRFSDYHKAGINRLSIGVQSFQNEKLKILGRIHERDEALRAIDGANKIGFSSINIDLMYGLPGQSIEDALMDLRQAIASSPAHLSWYQLTLEPNTVFAKYPPTLPDEETRWAMQVQGQAFLAEKGYQQYEVSAYCVPGFEAKQNVNYWQFGDYLGIGAGAHSKITQPSFETIVRYQKQRYPKDYLTPEKPFVAKKRALETDDRVLEFMMNVLRLKAGVPAALFEARTGLALPALQPGLARAYDQGLMERSTERLQTTPQGFRFLNDCLGCFVV